MQFTLRNVRQGSSKTHHRGDAARAWSLEGGGMAILFTREDHHRRCMQVCGILNGILVRVLAEEFPHDRRLRRRRVPFGTSWVCYHPFEKGSSYPRVRSILLLSWVRKISIEEAIDLHQAMQSFGASDVDEVGVSHHEKGNSWSHRRPPTRHARERRLPSPPVASSSREGRAGW